MTRLCQCPQATYYKLIFLECRLAFLRSETLGRFQNSRRDRPASVIPGKFIPKILNCLDLRHRIESFSNKKLHINMAGRLQASSEFGFCASDTFCHTADPTMLAGQHRDDAIGLSQFLGPYNNRLITVEAHGLTVMAAFIESRDLWRK